MTPHIDIAHTTPYWLASCQTTTHDGAIRNLSTFIAKTRESYEATLATRKFPYVDKWLSNEQINHKLSNHLWKNANVSDTQITQTLKFRFAQYMGHHGKNIFQPLNYPNPNCTLCRNNDRDTWPHILSTCEHPYLKGLRIARHNKATHLITQTPQANKNTRFYTLTNDGNLNNQPHTQQSQNGSSKCICPQQPCQCQAKLRPDILCILGAPNQTHTPISPSTNYTVQSIEFTYCHDRFPKRAITNKQTKYDPLVHNILKTGWKTNPLITITLGVRGAIHEHCIEQLTKLKLPKSSIKTLMKNLHHNAIKYLTYLVLKLYV